MRAFTIPSLMLMIGTLLLAPRSAAAQSQETAADAVRLSPYLLVGAGGEADPSNLPGEYDLDATVGLGIRLGVPVWDYIIVGGLFEWGAFEVEGVDDRDHLLDVDAFVGGRYVLDAADMALELHVLLPVGFSAAFFDNDLVEDETGLGWNLGLLFGATLFVTDAIGVLVDIGFMHHGLNVDPDIGDDYEIDANQARFNFGAAFAF